MKIARCPCGKIPEKLIITETDQSPKWRICACDQCGEWMIEFRSGYSDSEKEIMEKAIKEWNAAPRNSGSDALKGADLI